MTERLVDQLLEKAYESCMDCYFYSRVDHDKRDRYNEHALNALLAVSNNLDAEFYERECAAGCFRRCSSCRHSSPRIRGCIDKAIYREDTSRPS